MRGGLPAFVESGAFALGAFVGVARNSHRAHLVAAMGDGSLVPATLARAQRSARCWKVSPS
jgi:hypothetical protein